MPAYARAWRSFARSRSTPITRAPPAATTNARRPSPVPRSKTDFPRKSSWRNWSSIIGRRASTSLAASRHGSVRLARTTSGTALLGAHRPREIRGHRCVSQSHTLIGRGSFVERDDDGRAGTRLVHRREIGPVLLGGHGGGIGSRLSWAQSPRPASYKHRSTSH